MRLLVLGSDSDAQKLRDQAVAAGYELAQRYSVRVSHVAYGSGIDPDDARYSRIREAGLPIVPIQACASELGLGSPVAAGAGAGASASAGIAVGAADTIPGEWATDDTPAELDQRASDHFAHGVLPAAAAGIEVEIEVEVGVTAGIRGETAHGESLGGAALDELAAEALEFPPFERLAGSSSGLVPGFEVASGIEITEADAESESESDAEADLRAGAAESDAPSAAVATDTADDDDQEDEAADSDDLPVGGEVIGADPWLGEALDADITGYIPQITDATTMPDGVPGVRGLPGGPVGRVGGAGAVAAVETSFGAGATATATADADADAFKSAPAAAETPAPAFAAPSAKRRPTRRFLLSLVWGLVPFVSFGLLTPIVFGYAAYRLRSRSLAVAALGYTLAVVLSFALSAARPSAATPGDASGTLLTFALAVTWIGGTVHGLSLRTKIFLG